MQDTVIQILNQYGYFGVFFLIMVENIFPPIPSEIILTFGGFMTTYAGLNIWGVILAATIGSVAGAIALYALGRILGTERLEKLFAGKLGRLLHLKKEDVRRAEAWFLQRGNKAIFFCRFVPIVRSLISIPAGVSQMKWAPFVTLTALGTCIWNIVLVFLGRIAGNAWSNIAHYVDTYALIAAGVIALLVIVFAFIFIKKRFIKK